MEKIVGSEIQRCNIDDCYKKKPNGFLVKYWVLNLSDLLYLKALSQI